MTAKGQRTNPLSRESARRGRWIFDGGGEWMSGKG
jgi:hypothetical protein